MEIRPSVRVLTSFAKPLASSSRNGPPPQDVAMLQTSLACTGAAAMAAIAAAASVFLMLFTMLSSGSCRAPEVSANHRRPVNTPRSPARNRAGSSTAPIAPGVCASRPSATTAGATAPSPCRCRRRPRRTSTPGTWRTETHRKDCRAGSGDGSGNWRLELTTDPTDLKMEALAYIRTTEGFVTSMHEVAAETQGGSNRYHVPFFNPGRNASATGGRAGPGGPIASVSNRRGGDRKG